MKGFMLAFEAVLEWSITAAFVCLAVCLLRLFLKKAPKIFSYALWAVVFFRFLCPFALPGPVSIVPRWESVLEVMPEFGKGAGGSGGSVVSAGKRPPSYRLETGFSAGKGLTSAVLVLPPAAPEEREYSREEKTGGRETIPNAALTGNPYLSTPLPALIWVGGMGILAAVQGRRSFLWKRYIRRRKRGEEEGACVVDGIRGPFTMGFLHPVIYVPDGLTPAQRQYVLLHEQTHIRRRDYLLKPAAFCVACLHWFNPFAWLSYRLMCMDMEMSCDEAVLSCLQGRKKKEYAQTLMVFAGTGAGDSGLAFGEPYAKKRIRNVLSYQRPAYRMCLVLTAVCLAVSGCLMTSPAETEPKETAEAVNPQETKDKESGQTKQEALWPGGMTERERLDYFTAYLNAPERNVFLASGETEWTDSGSYMETEKLDGMFIRYLAFALKERITAKMLSPQESGALAKQGLDVEGSLVRVSRDTIRRAWEEGTGRPIEAAWFDEYLSGWYEWNGKYYQVETGEEAERLPLVCEQASQESEGRIRLVYRTAGEEDTYWTGEAILAEAETGWYFVSNKKERAAADAGSQSGEEEGTEKQSEENGEEIAAYYASFAAGSTAPGMTEDFLEWEADLTHNGQTERIVFDFGHFHMASTGVMAVLDGQGKVLYSDEAGAAHTGWRTWYLCRWEGQDYLLEYSPYSGTGGHFYHYELFSFDEAGEKAVLDSGSIEWQDIQEPDFMMDIPAMVEFAETVNAYIEASYLLVSTDPDMLGESLSGSGRELFQAGSPQEPHRIPETYRVLENNEPEIPGLGKMDDLGEKIRIWCEAVGRAYIPAGVSD